MTPIHNEECKKLLGLMGIPFIDVSFYFLYFIHFIHFDRAALFYVNVAISLLLIDAVVAFFSYFNKNHIRYDNSSKTFLKNLIKAIVSI